MMPREPERPPARRTDMNRTWIVAAAAAALVAAASPAAELRFAVPFIDDDYPRAVAEAKARNLPIFVENWAPW
jgi:hypothetical protein